MKPKRRTKIQDEDAPPVRAEPLPAHVLDFLLKLAHMQLHDELNIALNDAIASSLAAIDQRAKREMWECMIDRKIIDSHLELAGLATELELLKQRTAESSTPAARKPPKAGRIEPGNGGASGHR